MSIEEKNKKARDTFFKLLKSYRKISGEPFTHTSLGYPKGCYDIKGGRRPKLIKLYGKANTIDFFCNTRDFGWSNCNTINYNIKCHKCGTKMLFRKIPKLHQQ